MPLLAQANDVGSMCGKSSRSIRTFGGLKQDDSELTCRVGNIWLSFGKFGFAPFDKRNVMDSACPTNNA